MNYKLCHTSWLIDKNPRDITIAGKWADHCVDSWSGFDIKPNADGTGSEPNQDPHPEGREATSKKSWNRWGEAVFHLWPAGSLCLRLPFHPVRPSVVLERPAAR